jgi:signal transduction histidine kinase
VSFALAATPWQGGGPHGIGWITLALLLLLVWPAYAYVRRLLRPLDDIRRGAERFGSGRFDEPIPLRRRDELGDLAARINTMAHDLEGMLDAKRSPLTRARLNAELLPTSATGDAPGETERAALLRDLNEMRDLITDLLESERLASPHAALLREPTDLAALVRETVADLPELPDAEQVVINAPETPHTLPHVSVDRTRLRLLVRNALDNALRYSAGASAPPVISLAAEAGGVRITVRDFGPGVDAAQLARLTEPFYRTDSARQRATGGVGLGMYLCRLVAEAHGSRLDVCNAKPGLSVSLLLK